MLWSRKNLGEGKAEPDRTDEELHYSSGNGDGKEEAGLGELGGRFNVA